jgi:hypothetical protein
MAFTTHVSYQKDVKIYENSPYSKNIVINAEIKPIITKHVNND